MFSGTCNPYFIRGQSIENENIEAYVLLEKAAIRRKLKNAFDDLSESLQHTISRSRKHLTPGSETHNTSNTDGVSVERLDRPDTTPATDSWTIEPWSPPYWRRVLNYVLGSFVEEFMETEDDKSLPPSEDSFPFRAFNVFDIEPYQGMLFTSIGDDLA